MFLSLIAIWESIVFVFALWYVSTAQSRTYNEISAQTLALAFFLINCIGFVPVALLLYGVLSLIGKI